MYEAEVKATGMARENDIDQSGINDALEVSRLNLEQEKSYIDILNKEQAAAIEKGVKDQIEFRRKEIVQMEQNKANLEKRIKDLKDYHDQHHKHDEIVKFHAGLREKVQTVLTELSFDLGDFDHVEDEKNTASWEALAKFLEQAAQAIRAVAVHGHKPALETMTA